MNRSKKIALLILFAASATPFLWPQSFAAPTAPVIANLTPIEELGKNIFFDPSLSEPAGTSCAACHDPATGFSGTNGGIHGVPKSAKDGVEAFRAAPNISYIGFTPAFHIEKDEEGADLPVGGFFLDGRVSSLEEQAMKPFLNEREMNNGTEEKLAEKLVKASYAASLEKIGGAGVLSDAKKTAAVAARALAAFQKTAFFQPFSSRFDDYLRGKEQLTALEKQGLDLFMDEKKGNCAACHIVDLKSKNPEDSLMTDYTYDNLGVPRNAEIADNAKKDFYDLGLCGPERTAPKDDEAYCGAFKVPTLRNVAKKISFFHNGSFNDLRDVVSFYVTRDTDPDKWYKQGGKFNDLPEKYHANVNTSEAPYDRKKGETPRLNDAEVDAVVAFMKTLSDR